MVAEDVITMVEIQVDLAAEVRVQEEKETLLQDVKADLEAKEVRLQEEEKEEKAEFLKEHQDVLKALAIRQDQEDQEEIN